MAKSEALTLSVVKQNEDSDVTNKEGYSRTVSILLIPICALFIATLSLMVYTGIKYLLIQRLPLLVF